MDLENSHTEAIDQACWLEVEEAEEDPEEGQVDHTIYGACFEHKFAVTAFNWKVKKAIDMGFEVNEVKADELKTFGDFEDLKKILDFSKAKKVDLTDSIEYVSEGTNQSEEYEDEYAGMTGFRKAGIRKKVKHTRGPRPVVDMSQLYGSHKVAYRIPDLHDPKREKKRFSHKRVFGTAESA